MFEIENVEWVIEQEAANPALGLTDLASTYALALRKAHDGDVDWTRVNRAITQHRGQAFLRRVKTRAWHYVEGKREFGT